MAASSVIIVLFSLFGSAHAYGGPSSGYVFLVVGIVVAKLFFWSFCCFYYRRRQRVVIVQTTPAVNVAGSNNPVHAGYDQGPAVEQPPPYSGRKQIV